MNRTRPLTADEYVALKAALRGRMACRDRCLVVMLRRGGFRISELLSLRLGDVVDLGQILPDVAVAKRHTKGKRRGYSVPLHAEAREALAAWIERLAEGGRQTAESYLFPPVGLANRPMSREAAWQVIHRAAKRAGLRGCIGTHSLRKTFGTDIYLRSGRDIRITQEALHHATVEATIAYLPVAHELLRGLVMSDGVARLILADGPGLDGAT